jgi:hypothetical protein
MLYILLSPFATSEGNLFMPRPKPFTEDELPRALLVEPKKSKYLKEVDEVITELTDMYQQDITLNASIQGDVVIKAQTFAITANTIPLVVVQSEVTDSTDTTNITETITSEANKTEVDSTTEPKLTVVSKPTVTKPTVNIPKAKM